MFAVAKHDTFSKYITESPAFSSPFSLPITFKAVEELKKKNSRQLVEPVNFTINDRVPE